MKKIFSIIFAIAMLVPSSLAYAQEAESQDAKQNAPRAEAQGAEVCDLQPYLGYLREIQAGEYTPTTIDEQNDADPTDVDSAEEGEDQASEEQEQQEEVEEVATSTDLAEDKEAELAPGPFYPDEKTVRRELMVRVMDCAIADVEKLKESVQALELVGVEESSLQERFVARIEQAIRYYESQKERLNKGDLSVEKMKQLARNLQNWRNGEYLRLEQNTQNFFVWAKNEELLDTARTRLSRVRQTIKDFNLGKHDLVEDSFDRADFFINRSFESHRSIQNRLVHDQDPKLILEELKDSASDLYRAYREFFTLSGTVRGYLLTQ